MIGRVIKNKVLYYTQSGIPVIQCRSNQYCHKRSLSFTPPLFMHIKFIQSNVRDVPAYSVLLSQHLLIHCPWCISPWWDTAAFWKHCYKLHAVCLLRNCMTAAEWRTIWWITKGFEEATLLTVFLQIRKTIKKFRLAHNVFSFCISSSG